MVYRKTRSASPFIIASFLSWWSTFSTCSGKARWNRAPHAGVRSLVLLGLPQIRERAQGTREVPPLNEHPTDVAGGMGDVHHLVIADGAAEQPVYPVAETIHEHHEAVGVVVA